SVLRYTPEPWRRFECDRVGIRRISQHRTGKCPKAVGRVDNRYRARPIKIDYTVADPVIHWQDHATRPGLAREHGTRCRRVTDGWMLCAWSRLTARKPAHVVRECNVTQASVAV